MCAHTYLGVSEPLTKALLEAVPSSIALMASIVARMPEGKYRRSCMFVYVCICMYIYVYMNSGTNA